ncbi:MAG: TonB-dependent receptor [Flavobacterium sp.]|uniref:TonB-dependent receptor n=1 Tax=Flavobacterium sp. TaxID=239 RepID=UPI0025BD4253|nr:TonB-dependent receptor [Flavobacterium sp.]MBA4134805.1 TonB-dependent receptor [Flavobacterium sp.]
MKQVKYIAAILFVTQIVFAQKKDENIGTEVVNVVKPYTPTISDAFKVKETPSLDDEETQKKENIKYTIFSFPVASTFAPAKGKAAGVDKSPQEKIFSNYLTLAAGNYGTVNAELFVTENVSNTDYFGGSLRHSSSQGGIDGVFLDDKFMNSTLDLTYGSRTNTMNWNADLGYQHQIYNWYGFYPGTITPETLATIDEQQTYHTLYVGGRLGLNNILKESSVKFTRFWDAFGSAENRFVAKPSLEFDIVEQKIKADFVLDYISGSFDKNMVGNAGIKYGFTNVGFQPSIKIQKDDLTVNAGVGFFYSAAQEQGESKFFIYPQVTGSYRVVGDLMIFYAGLEGGLKQNSYRDFVQENFFVSPTLMVAPTDQKYDIYVGLKGKLANSVSYNIRGSYVNEDNRALFKSNGYEELVGFEGYQYGNSFNVVYDKLKTVSFFGELKADFSKNVAFGINGTFSSYSTDGENEAWNLPALKLGASLDVNITQKWYAGTNVFFVGERKDFAHFASLTQPTFDTEVTLDSFFDLNAHIGYKHSERLTFFLKGNNLANQDYQRWLNYPVQGLQVLGGANYKFDF